jgi:NIPSNAP
MAAISLAHFHLIVKWRKTYTIFMLQKLFLLLTLLAACASAQSRVFELRTYTCYDGKLEALKADFRDHHLETFKRHGIESIGYWVPQDPELAKNTLIYLLAHPSRAAAEKNWAEFRKDPEFLKVMAESKKNGDMVKKIESVYLDPTDFSPLK